ncbi:MAG: rod shape-determining protein MreC [Verrucomicrobiota bacterium]
MSFNRFNLVAFLIFIALFVGVIMLPTPQTRKIQSTILTFFGFGTKTVHNVTSNPDNYNGVDLSAEALLQDPKKLASDYADLYKEFGEMKVWKAEAKKLEADNAQLRRALDFKREYETSLEIIAARIIERQASTWWETVLIDRGEKHGVFLEDPVVADNGALVGKIIQLAPDTSRVLLLTDEACQVSARIQGTLEKGILSGSRVTMSDQTPELRLKYLSKDATVPVGARIFSTGVYRKDLEMELGVFPANLPLGNVKSFRKRDTYGEVVVEPNVDFYSLTDVFVIQPPREKQTAPPAKPSAPTKAIPVPSPLPIGTE